MVFNKIFCILLSLLVIICSCGCTSLIPNTESKSDSYQPEQWYSYKDLDIVYYKNCYVSEAFVRNSGGVFVTYAPLCKGCIAKGPIGCAIVSQEESYMKTHYCDCGEQTTLVIKVII